MSSLEELMEKARMLHAEGHPTGQIADELSLSTDTITWMLTQGKNTASAPKDVHIDWTTVSSDATLLNGIASMLMVNFENCCDEDEEIDAVVGVDAAGIPLATLMAAEHGLNLAIYHPSKHNADTNCGSISGNFSKVTGKRCNIVDDCITTGICVLFDKRGVREIEGVPVYPLFSVKRID